MYGATRENPVINGKIYVTHGHAGTPFFVTNYAYDPATNTWEQKASADYARDGVGCGVINNKLYVVGGRDVPTIHTVYPGTKYMILGRTHGYHHQGQSCGIHQAQVLCLLMARQNIRAIMVLIFRNPAELVSFTLRVLMGLAMFMRWILTGMLHPLVVVVGLGPKHRYVE